jgi:hypothetical protein
MVAVQPRTKRRQCASGAAIKIDALAYRRQTIPKAK